MVTVQKHQGIYVVRDDLLIGGTKSRYLTPLFDQYDEIVYATPAHGGAQVALAYGAYKKGKKATLFVAERKEKHQRTQKAASFGAKIVSVKAGYLNVLQSRAKAYAKSVGAYYLAFGGDSPETIETIGQAAREVNDNYGDFDQVWCASGSGVLTRGLQAGIPNAEFFAVQVGRELTEEARGIAQVLAYPMKFEDELHKIVPPFPSCPNYDRKAWHFCKKYSKGKVLFWNVMG